MTARPRPATTVCAVRDLESMEVLMVHRSETARFMGGAWVFPGGVVDDADRSEHLAALVRGVGVQDLPWVAAGVRELIEEVGLWITDTPFIRRVEAAPRAVYDAAADLGVTFAGESLALFANWVTPAAVAMRFDTRFYAVAVPAHLAPEPDATEVDYAKWLPPATVLEAAEDGSMVVPFPTRKTLQLLARFGTTDDFIAEARRRRVERVQPRVRIGDDGGLEIVMPGEPGFDEIDESAGPDPEALRRAARISGEAPEVGA